jgi:alanine racemase
VTSTATEHKLREATRPTWAEVSLAALRRNFRTVQQHVGRGVTVCAVLKAHAYGHGAVECAHALEAEGADWFGVTTTDEGVALRDAGVRSRILLMTGFWRGDEEEVIRQNLTSTVWEAWQVESLDRAAARLGVPPQPVHLKVDTGMARLGVSRGELESLCGRIKTAARVSLEGVCTHFASSEVLDSQETAQQALQFEDALRTVRVSGLSPVFCHMANSGAVVARPQSWKNMVRPGILLYGYCLRFQRGGKTAEDVPPLDLAPVLSWKTRVLSLKRVGAGQRLGYGGTYTTKAPSRIAALPVGYADGLNRQLSSRGRVIVRGQYAPIVGLISMDLTLVDVTAVSGVEMGDEVILLGSSGVQSVTALDHARWASTAPYEILCAISKRVPRKYST